MEGLQLSTDAVRAVRCAAAAPAATAGAAAAAPHQQQQQHQQRQQPLFLASQAVTAAACSVPGVPWGSWAREVVVETALADAAEEAAGGTCVLSPAFAALLAAAAAADNSGSSTSGSASQHPQHAVQRAPKSSRGGASAACRQRRRPAGSPQQSHALAPALQTQLGEQFGELLRDCYDEIDDGDVAAFGLALLHGVARLVAAAEAEQQAEADGLCALCERDMPLTKHHLIPRDVHGEFKKRHGFTAEQLQQGLLVCRPCHTAIHRTVPDNRELGLNFRTLQALKQHEPIARFAAWASKQRVASKADVNKPHHRYMR